MPRNHSASPSHRHLKEARDPGNALRVTRSLWWTPHSRLRRAMRVEKRKHLVRRVFQAIADEATDTASAFDAFRETLKDMTEGAKKAFAKVDDAQATLPGVDDDS